MSNPNVPGQNPESLRERISKEAQLAYNGLRNVISQIRMNRAGNTMERMDHKDALYEHAGQLALGEANPTIPGPGGPNAVAFPNPRAFRDITERRYDPSLPQGGEMVTPSSRGFFERKRRNRIEKLGFEAKVKAVRRKKVAAIYMGSKTSLSSVPQRTSQIREGIKLGAQDMPHTERLAAKAEISRRKHPGIKQRRNSEQRRVAVAESVGKKHAEVAADQPILSRWREGRRKHAIGTIQSSHKALEERRAKIRRLKNLPPPLPAPANTVLTPPTPNVTPVAPTPNALPPTPTPRRPHNPSSLFNKAGSGPNRVPTESSKMRQLSSEVMDDYRTRLNRLPNPTDSEKKALFDDLLKEKFFAVADQVSADRSSDVWVDTFMELSERYNGYTQPRKNQGQPRQQVGGKGQAQQSKPSNQPSAPVATRKPLNPEQTKKAIANILEANNIDDAQIDLIDDKAGTKIASFLTEPGYDSLDAAQQTSRKENLRVEAITEVIPSGVGPGVEKIIIQELLARAKKVGRI